MHIIEYKLPAICRRPARELARGGPDRRFAKEKICTIANNPLRVIAREWVKLLSIFTGCSAFPIFVNRFSPFFVGRTRGKN